VESGGDGEYLENSGFIEGLSMRFILYFFGSCGGHFKNGNSGWMVEIDHEEDERRCESSNLQAHSFLLL
jgi:hypothetical protein